jgi:hypothetical protein
MAEGMNECRKGSVCLSSPAQAHAAHFDAGMVQVSTLNVNERHLRGLPADMLPEAPRRTFQYGPGAIVGANDFFLQQPHAASASSTQA